MAEAQIDIDVVGGTSIGALVGGCFVAGKLEELQEFALRLTKRRIFSLLDFSWRGGGLITGDRLRDMLNEQIGDIRIEDLDRPFVCIATELLTGHEIWLKSGRLSESIRASYALPGVFKPINLRNQWLIDGAVVNPIPVSVCRAMGARVVIAVNVNADAFGGTVIQQPDLVAAIETAGQDEKQKSKPLPPVFSGNTPPGISAVLVTSFNIAQDRLARSRLAGDPPDILITPRTGNVGLFDFEKAAEAIEAGREAADRALPEIRWALNRLGQTSAF
ncbi:NTE family protein [Rhodoligotrophos appendicifer]